MAIDKKKIEEHMRGILIALGDNPDREGLKETPMRVAKMFEEVFEGMNYSNREIADMFGKTFQEGFAAHQDGNDIVLVKDMEVFSYCEHHMALMYNMKVSVAYLPVDRVIGLSKIARIAEMAAKRLQLQERICSDIADIMTMATGSPHVAVLVQADHSCISARGIKNTSARTISSVYRGRFDTDAGIQNKLTLMLGQ